MVKTLVSAWNETKQRLDAAGIDGPVIDARLLVEAAAGATRADIIADPRRVLTRTQTDALEAFVARREQREPVSHILGAKGFWTIMLRVTRDVLTPRTDTETILDVVLPMYAENAHFEALDLGVGSGAILLALLAERPNARGVGVDSSEKALEVAHENAELLGLSARAHLVHGDWALGLECGRFDLVVCNPPYIPTRDIRRLAPEVRDFEPHIALDGGADGLRAFRVLASEIVRVLRPGGRFAVEFGVGQAGAVQQLFTHAGAEALVVAHDLAGRERVLAGRKKALG